MGDDLKEKIKDSLKYLENSRGKEAKSEPGATQTATGNNNIQLQAAGDIKINTKEVHQHKLTPGPQHITPAQAYKLQQKVYEAAKIEALSGKHTEKEMRIKWWSKLKKKYQVPNYQVIPAEFGEASIAWLTQEVAKLRPKQRRHDPQAWKNSHYTAIWARSRELGLPRENIYALASLKLDKSITSLKQLTQRELQKFYNIIMAMQK